MSLVIGILLQEIQKYPSQNNVKSWVSIHHLLVVRVRVLPVPVVWSLAQNILSKIDLEKNLSRLMMTNFSPVLGDFMNDMQHLSRTMK